jgi:hypothetical protein
MEQSPSQEANSRPALQNIPSPLWNMKVQYCLYKKSPAVPVLSRINPVHILHVHYFKIHFNIILPLSLGFESGVYFSGFRIIFCMHFYHMRATSPVHLILLNLLTNFLIYAVLSSSSLLPPNT